MSPSEVAARAGGGFRYKGVDGLTVVKRVPGQRCPGTCDSRVESKWYFAPGRKGTGRCGVAALPCPSLACLPAQSLRASLSGMRRGRILLLSAGLIGLFLAWYVGSPWWTLRRMDEAARAGDWATVASTMDMDAVRKASEANAAAGVRGALQFAREAHSAEERDFGLRNAETFRQMARRGPAELAQEVADAIAFRPTELIEGSLWFEPRFERSGIDTFTIRRNATPSPGTFVFRRHGLGWRLDAVRWGWPEKLGRP